jgi:glycine dehydrogenase subunit 1
LLDESCSALVLQSPNFFGTIEDHSALFASAKAKGITAISVFNPALMGVLASPGEMGADIAIAEGQPLGLPLSFGGPYLGIMAASKGYVRKMPGRIVGETVDKNGSRCFVLTLQAREQHIRREKATSNICSNQALCALRAVVYVSLLGREGLIRLGTLLASKGNELKTRLSKIVTVEKGVSLNEFTVKLPCNAASFAKSMSERGILAGIPASLHYKGMDNHLIIAITEKRTAADIDAYISAFESVLKGA